MGATPYDGFGVGSLACGLAPDMPALVAGRIVQGVGGGAFYALSLAVITTSRPKDEHPAP